MLEITSTKNSYIKELKKLEKKKHRDASQCYLIEGEHLVGEAIKHGANLETILVTEAGRGLLANFSELARTTKSYLVTEEVFKVISSVPAPQGIMAVVHQTNDELNQKTMGPYLLLDNVQDPGNVGTMIRTADAAGFGTVILGEGCADIYSAKVLRSMQGSQFHVTLIQSNLMEAMTKLKEKNIAIYGTELNPEAISYRDLVIEGDYGLVMGNEGQGVSKEILNQTRQNIYIPIDGQAESLNVAIAAGILMFSLRSL
ncbi:TrmH family RNA methyltransferase [Vagococcus intermedius]|uniref:RNA methyltransferase n=1 Tax=Vagococcus intermedius TaxID=2991418 RepID=A0AAF0CTI6_9ENTE|nr:RNA methyltransferase [Vagococcus intermedius]WEG72685.1 RNA methyltransferase [Vagococcus intermedius]WEG74770.1 RNA methyltransferase [Vagococcus intermedius]